MRRSRSAARRKSTAYLCPDLPSSQRHHEAARRRATLHILDAATGKPLFTSGDGVTGTANPETALAVANGRVYFSTVDNTVYCFGIPTEH